MLLNRKKQPIEQEVGVDIQPTNQTKPQSQRSLRIAFFGTEASFSHRVLQKMVEADVKIYSVFCDASEPFRPHLGFDIYPLDPPPPFGSESLEIKLHVDPSMGTSNIIDIGWREDVPVYSVGSIQAEAVADTLESLRIDVACVACFNKKIPKSLLAIPKYGFLNLHPSLLPDYRGPEPIQWILHDLAQPVPPQNAQGGATVHWMDERFDTGDIAMQRSVKLNPQMTYRTAERLCADAGANVYLEVLGELAIGNVLRTPQGDGGFYRGRMQ